MRNDLIFNMLSICNSKGFNFTVKGTINHWSLYSYPFVHRIYTQKVVVGQIKSILAHAVFNPSQVTF